MCSQFAKSYTAVGRSAALVLALALGACAQTTPHYENTFGNAVRSAVATQTLDPAAVRNTTPVNGMDGRAARSAYENYQKSFRDPQPVEPMHDLGGKK